MNKDKYECVTVLDFQTVCEKLGDREETGHKGTFGTLLCVCGSKGMAGAAVLSILAALKMGVGMVKATVPHSVYDIAAKRLLEPVFLPVEEDMEGKILYKEIDKIIEYSQKCSAMLIGCGLGGNNDINRLVQELVGSLNIPLIIDADGINALAKNINILKYKKCSAVITPHIGEMAKLLNVSIKDVISNGFKYAREISKNYGIVTVLKSSETIISDEEGKLFLHNSPNSGMAKGGSGDVLAGMTGSLLAQGISPIDSALCGVFLHSLAGKICKEKYSKTSMLPTDMINALPEIFLKMNR